MVFDTKYNESTTGQILSDPNAFEYIFRAILVVLILWICVVNFLFIKMFLKRNLFRPPEIFILSLSVADFFLGAVVMPIGFCKVCKIRLPLLCCRIWISMDVLFSTSSILSILLISFDRSLACFSPFAHYKYRNTRVAQRFLASIWVSSILVALWSFIVHDDAHYVAYMKLELNTEDNEKRIDDMFWNSQVAYYEIRNNSLIEHHICDLRMDRTFAVWSATISFYLPIFLILFCTCLLYKSGSNALKRLDAGHVSSEKFRDFSPKSISIEDKNHIMPHVKLGNRFSGFKHKVVGVSYSAPSPYNEMPHQMERPKTSDALSTATTTTMGRSVRNGNRASFKSSFNRSEYSSSSNRLLRTCLLVSVTFLVCWFPFACLNPLMSYYPKWFGAPYGWVLHEVSIWMGWMNSAFNPVIYYYVVKAKATKRAHFSHKYYSVTALVAVPRLALSLRDRDRQNSARSEDEMIKRNLR